MIKGFIHQEYITNLNIYASNKSAHQNKNIERCLSWLKCTISIPESKVNIAKMGLKIFM